jgi:hypothetical protein
MEIVDWLASISRSYLKCCMKENNEGNQEPAGSRDTGSYFTKTEDDNRIHTRSSEHDTDGKARRGQWKDGEAEGEQERDADGKAERGKDRPSGAKPMIEEDTIGIP